MSSACPKCGAEIDDVYNAATFFKCGTRCYKDGKKYTTKICRVRAEAIAELDAWHTGEPEVCVNRINYECENPEDGVQVAWRDYDGQWLHFEREMHGNYVVAPFNGPFNKWREVRQ